ncbi:unnamed protein product, partial [marine sediment metagenome]
NTGLLDHVYQQEGEDRVLYLEEADAEEIGQQVAEIDQLKQRHKQVYTEQLRLKSPAKFKEFTAGVRAAAELRLRELLDQLHAELRKSRKFKPAQKPPLLDGLDEAAKLLNPDPET